MFDPLHKWLGIPPEEQPPNHYRLLGIAAFESDTEVIDAAADKQLAFLHDLTNGEYGEEAEQLSNQVSAARLCLLNPEKKSAYDSTLHGQQERSQTALRDPSAGSPLTLPSSAGPAINPGTGPSINPVTGEPYIAAPSDSSPLDPAYTVASSAKSKSASVASVSTRRSRPKSKTKKYLMASSALCLIVLGLVAIGVYQGKLVLDFALLESLGVPAPQSEPGPSTSPSVTSPSPSEPTPTSRPPSTDSTTGPRYQDDTTGNPPVRPPRRSPTEPGASNRGTTPPSGSTPSKPRSLGDLLHGGASSSETAPVVMESLPTESQIESKMELIRELYQEEYQDAQTPQKRLELAQLMHREGQNTNDDSVGRYTLWKVARDIMVREGEFAAAVGIADNMQTHYRDVDALQQKTQILQDAAGSISAPNVSSFVDTAREVIGDCMAGERFGLAQSFAEALKESLTTKATATQLATFDELLGQIHDAELAFKEYQLAFVTLEKSVNDPEANESAGRFLCFIRGDWDAGLPHLAQASDANLQTLAELEMGSSYESENAIEVADGWYDVAEKENGITEQTNIRRHALKWYREIVASASGLQQRKIESRITTLERILPHDDDSDVDVRAGSAKELQYRLHTSKDSRSDFVDRKDNTFTMGMGSRPDGQGEAIAGLELQNAKRITVVGSASQDMNIAVDAFSKTGFMIDYHTPGGYVKRVFLGLGLKPGRRFTEAPTGWGKKTRPDVITDIGRENTYKIDLQRWAPSTWDGRCWFSIYMQNAGPNRTVSATVSWESD